MGLHSSSSLGLAPTCEYFFSYLGKRLVTLDLHFLKDLSYELEGSLHACVCICSMCAYVPRVSNSDMWGLLMSSHGHFVGIVSSHNGLLMTTMTMLFLCFTL